jgi:hypothetical protein
MNKYSDYLYILEMGISPNTSVFLVRIFYFLLISRRQILSNFILKHCKM